MNVPRMQSRSLTSAEIEARVIRYADLRPCYNAFIDTRTPGSEAKENFTIIGPGVSENPEQYVHIAEPHGFNVGGARQPPGCVNSQHSHDTAEVFIVHSGRWRFNFGEHGDDARVTVGPGDVISLPVKCFRGFTNVGEDTGFLFAILGQDDPGRVIWAPAVFDMAQEYGLVLLESGRLVDTIAGQKVPPDARPMSVTSMGQVKQMKRVSQDEAERFVWRNSDNEGDAATSIIGNGGPLNWPHGFAVERLDMESATDYPRTVANSPEVLFVHVGSLNIRGSEGQAELNPGDTITIPPGEDWKLSTTSGCVAYCVNRD